MTEEVTAQDTEQPDREIIAALRRPTEGSAP